MTIIAFKNGVMAADSEMSGGGLRYRVIVPKIARGPGGLAGAVGASSDCVALLQWFAAGEIPEDRPVFVETGDEAVEALVARPDGTLWRIFSKHFPLQVEEPYALGGGHAWSFCEGAMKSGKSAEQAVRLTIKNFSTVGGKVQVEKLHP